MKIIVTGATGAFGAAITKYLHERGHEIIAVGRMKEPPIELAELGVYMSIDITEPFSLPAADVCIHAAALSDDKATPEQLYAPNVLGIKHVLDAAKDCKQFIFISSSSVYLPDKEPLKEGMAGKQNNDQLSPYGRSKLLSEEQIHEHFKGESCFILRARAFYGPGDVQILPRMMKLVKNDVFNKPGELKISLSMTHYLNMGRAIECCMESDKKGINTYNVADTEVYTMIDTLRSLFTSIYGKQLKEKKIPIVLLKILAFFRIGGFTPLLVRALTKNMVLDTQKIEKELGYKGVVTFHESLDEIQEWVECIGGPEVLRTGNKLLIWKKCPERS